MLNRRKTPRFGSTCQTVALIGVTLVLLTFCQPEPSLCADEPQADGQLAAPAANDFGDSAPDKQMGTRQPRQQFKIHLAQSKRQKSPSGHVANGKQQYKATKYANNDRQESKVNNNKRGGESGGQSGGGNGKKISNVALKKLLNQSVPKYGQTGFNSTSLANGLTSTNFKFKFIQRSAAPPGGATKKHDSADQKPTTGGATSAAQSLAASVSKQLASSLLYTAANLVTNKTLTGVTNAGASSSLSALATQVAANLIDRDLLGLRASGGSSSSSSSPPPSPSSNSSDSKQTPALETTKDKDDKSNQPDSSSSSSSQQQQDTRRVQSTKTKQQQAKRRYKPSKVYNIPVKFVSNGQANGIVLHAIRQHFATIKKLQQATGTGGDHFSTKRRRPSSSSVSGASGAGLRLTGKNSRLIYLPLKYLSNGRPNKLVATKAMHKQTKS